MRKLLTMCATVALLAVPATAGATAVYNLDFSYGVGDWSGAIAHTGDTGQVTGSAYSFWDGVLPADAWPEHGWVTELDVHLDPAAMAPGDGFDLTAASARQDGTHLRDFIFHVGKTAAGQLLVNGSNNTDFAVNDHKLANDGDGTPTEITAAGWYTFQHVFYDDGTGALDVDLNVMDATGTTIFTTTRSDAGDTLADVVGGPLYHWFTFADGSYDVDNHLLEVVTPAPGDKDDCKQGGFEAYGFDNQGQCVASLQAAEAASK